MTIPLCTKQGPNIVCQEWCERPQVTCTEPWPKPHWTPLGWELIETPDISAQPAVFLWLNGSESGGKQSKKNRDYNSHNKETI